MLIARPATLSDDKALFELARLAGPGFTSLAIGESALFKRLQKSVKSFNDTGKVSSDTAGDDTGDDKSTVRKDQLYLLMLEDIETGSIMGMSSVKAQIGITDPFFNFRILNLAQQSAVTGKRFDMEILMLVNEYAGASEVSSLFIKEEARGTGAGRLISQARYMLMASAPERFGEKVVSELRGHVDNTGYSPFWEAIGRKFFQMDFDEADRVSAKKNTQFISDLMPKHPIYAALLPDAAQAVMGQTHPLGAGARKLLEAEGFRYDGIIDIFDGGPSVSAPRDHIRTIKDSRRVTATTGDGEFPISALISNDKIKTFRAVFSSLRFEGGAAIFSRETMNALNLKNADTVRLWIKR